jgi:hypothetical protein
VVTEGQQGLHDGMPVSVAVDDRDE